ncbi:class Ib ribonucleoside-diphosphate reductase assembly flavoprotein NrdI [Erwinia tracheiphila]|uniref:Protein NrdI n=1 Tax=Erwinia tracheiphila TaxID=65700 RepID=A0A0M2KF80_9GAMM|nr:class Ib ribonucleoside-diphosphate reductase assembly flavoprotein NrdI [Erwinia tracheiphila]AXF75157.1 class Ib ribonucleoside-diphosphate reductase assembly flavoprotein NrdI [Erwinia tracheiphila]EOS94085.1 ribonucleotide reductase stimulatory protein [Erwinia tracheiphila PSU-1]KKF38035.1 ribonucleotide reductase stimulatory protein [Erwinia tracheiphila]UIA82299.1 class Ib ribonucleoside-diphosphate reductase assembly flavoprotein NrdI [Erwinia tracheiphila]UIA89426.1 class Ib ribonu
MLVYFSSQSENTHRFVMKTGLAAIRIPFNGEQHLRVEQPYILVVPSYGGGSAKGAVPRQVIRFLNDASNRELIRGVIAAGNRNFGEAYCIAGTIIAQKCQVPCLYRFELLGTSEDIANVSHGVTEFWLQQKTLSYPQI